MNIGDSELQRARWRRALDLHALDDARRADFALGGLATRLRDSTAQIVLLPSDPEAEHLHIDDALWAWLAAQQSVAVDSWVVGFGTQTYPTAHAAALVNGYGSNEPWNSYLAVHRSGALELGLGDRGGWERRTRDGVTVRGFNLISIVANTGALLTFNEALSERSSSLGPWQLTIGLRDTRNAVLGNLGEGWAEPGSIENRAPGCSEDDLLWHLRLDELPDDDALQRLASPSAIDSRTRGESVNGGTSPIEGSSPGDSTIDGSRSARRPTPSTLRPASLGPISERLDKEAAPAVIRTCTRPRQRDFIVGEHEFKGRDTACRVKQINERVADTSDPSGPSIRPAVERVARRVDLDRNSANRASTDAQICFHEGMVPRG